MTPGHHFHPHMRAIFTGLLLSLLGGWLFSLCHLPLPWMLGPLTFTGIAGVSGLPVRAVRGGRQTGQLLIGCILGQYFSPEVSRQILSLWWAMLASSLLAIGAGGIGGLLLARISGLDRRTAYFCTVAGGAAEMSILAERAGARFDRVALAQSLRVFIVVCTIPVIITICGLSGTDSYTPANRDVVASGLAWLIVFAALAGYLLHRADIPNAFILGPLLSSALLTMNGITLSALPAYLGISGQILMGWALGARFQPDLRKASPAFLIGVIAATLASMAVLLLVGIVIGSWLGIPLPTMALATAPGGISEMCVTARILKLGVPVVTAFQVARLAILLLTALPVYRGISWLTAVVEGSAGTREIKH